MPSRHATVYPEVPILAALALADFDAYPVGGAFDVGQFQGADLGESHPGGVEGFQQRALAQVLAVGEEVGDFFA